MSDMKCPFCQRELLLSSYRDDDIDNQMWSCLSCQLSAQRKLWQELICTRKALDVAVDEITKIKVVAESVGIGFFMTAAIFALAKIKTELEPKDK